MDEAETTIANDALANPAERRGNAMSASAATPSGEDLSFVYAPIAAHLHEVDRVLRSALDTKVPFINELTARVRLYQGKKVRPALLLLSAQACGVVTRDHHVLAAVMEMIHAATLVHDDLLDEAQTRRHVTTVHAEWGSEASVLLGDYLFSQAYSLAATCETAEACRIIGRATNRTCEGELQQISRRGYFDLDEAEYIDIIAGKTAELMACSCRLGAHFSDGPSHIVEELARFGQYLGISYQITDDLLDVVGDTSKTGKSMGTDWCKRKVTLPLIRLRETAAESDRGRLRAAFENPENGGDEVAELLKRSDAIEYSEQLAREYALKASNELRHLTPSPAKECLTRIAEFVVDRRF